MGNVCVKGLGDTGYNLDSPIKPPFALQDSMYIAAFFLNQRLF